MSRRLRRAFAVVALAGASLAAARPAASATLFVHVPDSPVDATRLATAANDLATELAAATGLAFEARIFRRHEDAVAYLAREGRSVTLLLVDHPFLLDLPPTLDAEPTHRLVRGGRETYQKLAVVRAGSAFQRLDDLHGAQVSLAQNAGASGTLFLEHVVLAGKVALGGGGLDRLEPVVDDLTAAANVIYGTTEAALVADYNPLVVAALGRSLRTLHASPPLSLPVVATRRGALDTQQQRAVDTALATLATRPRGAAALAALGVSAVRPLAERLLVREDLLRLVQDVPRTLEIALPPASALELAAPAPPPARHLGYVAGVQVPELPLGEAAAP